MESQKVLTRQDYNRQLADMLIAGIEKYPDWRFGQILRNLEMVKEVRNSDGNVIGWINEFNLEPEELLARSGGYKAILEKLGVFVKDNAKLAAKRLGVDPHSVRVTSSRAAKEQNK